MRKSTMLMVLAFMNGGIYFFNKSEINVLIVNILVIGYFIVKQLEENNK